MKQGNLTLEEYEKEFSRLSKYAPKLVLTETFRCRQFEDGLKESIKRYLTAMTSLQVVNFYQLMQAAMKIEKLEMKSQERNRERKFYKGSLSSGKMIRGSQVDSVHDSVTRGRRQGPTTTQAFQPNKMKDLNSPHCHKHHVGICI